MELKFDKSVCKSLHKELCQVLEQELTQEVRLTEALPDIGRVLGSWGQVILRSKEWRGNTAGVSGGVMAWVLYAPEDGTKPRSLEAWIPFQMKWDIPDVKRDGTICVLPLLKSVDSRSISARKLMLRANVSIQAEVYEPIEMPFYQIDHLPDDIQILRQAYPLEIPVEAGEKQFQIEEEVSLPDNYPKIDKICYFELLPQITEARILTDKLLFRGNAKFHMVYSGDDGTLQNWDQELTFSQFTHLDGERGPQARTLTYPVVTGLEVDLLHERPVIKGNLSAQYVVYDQILLELTEDVYSTARDVLTEEESLKLYSRLDAPEKSIELTKKVPLRAQKIYDVVWYPCHPIKRQNGEMLEVEQPGIFQIVYLDDDGNIQGQCVQADESWQIPSDPENDVALYPVNCGRPITLMGPEETALSVEMTVMCCVCSSGGLKMISGVEIGEVREPDPNRPSLILRKKGDSRLWDLAKSYGTKVVDILDANHLQGEPIDDQILLIPIT